MMWKDFSRSYLAHNRAAGWTVAAAALAAAFFLALAGSLFFNLWVYDLEQITLEEGSWEARLTVSQTDPALAQTIETLEQYANIKTVTVNQALSDPHTDILDLTFKERGDMFRDLAQIKERLALSDEAIATHDLLLSRYLVRNPNDPTSSLLLPFFLAVLGVVAAALVLLIRNSFEITMQARLHQFGILASIGATPRQIRTCLLQEAAALALAPLLLGLLLGFCACFGALAAVNAAAADVAGRHAATFQLHPLVVAGLAVAAFGTVLVSAWLPARRLSRMSPLEALRDGPAPSASRRAKRYKPAQLLRLWFGVRGELAGGALRAQKKSMRIANVSLLLSFLGFTAMLCFFTLSGISTDMTYFSRYQDAWDVMATVPQTALADFALTDELQALPGIESCVVYEKAETHCLLPQSAQSDALQALGGLSAVAGADAVSLGENWLVDAPVVVMDDQSFLAYCEETGVSPSLNGAVLLNRVWDSLHSNFRDRIYLPFVQPDTTALTLAAADGAPAGTLPLLGSTTAPPNLREEYDQYTLTLFIPLSLWQSGVLETAGPVGDSTLLIRVLGEGATTLADCEALQTAVSDLLAGAGYKATVENRIADRLSNDRMIAGAQAILGAFCVLLAAIGLANVFLNTLGFVGQRRREFARYLAIGMTPQELRSLFWIEAAVIAGRPLVITFPLTVLVVAFMLQASYLDPGVFLARAPVVPIVLFAALIVGAVALAYALGARKVLHSDLSELLKDDSLR